MQALEAIPLDVGGRNADQRAMSTDLNLVETTMLSLIAERGLEKTLCPSEVAIALGGKHPDGWGPLMQPVRMVAVQLAREGRLVILRKGKIADPDDFRGVYRLGLPRED